MIQNVVFIGAIVQLVGISVYIREIIRGNTKPNKISWLMWAITPFIATAAAISDGVRWATLPVFMAGFTALLVFIISFVNPKAYWKLGTFDYICGACSILALALWAITNEPLVAIIFSILSYMFGAIPTITKAWRYPETESIWTYMAGLFNAVTCFFALKIFSFAELAFPVYLVLESGLFVALIYRGQNLVRLKRR